MNPLEMTLALTKLLFALWQLTLQLQNLAGINSLLPLRCCEGYFICNNIMRQTRFISYFCSATRRLLPAIFLTNRELKYKSQSCFLLRRPRCFTRNPSTLSSKGFFTPLVGCDDRVITGHRFQDRSRSSLHVERRQDEDRGCLYKRFYCL